MPKDEIYSEGVRSVFSYFTFYFSGTIVCKQTKLRNLVLDNDLFFVFSFVMFCLLIPSFVYDMSSIFNQLMKIVLSLFAIPSLSFIVRHVSWNRQVDNMFQYFGRESLSIYVTHNGPFAFLLVLSNYVTLSSVDNILCFLFLLIFSLFICYASIWIKNIVSISPVLELFLYGKSYKKKIDMNIYFINPPFKAEYGKFSRESRSPAITKSGALYYPLWLIYAALYSSKQGHNVSFLDAPAKQLNEEQSLNIIRKTDNEHSLFVLDTSTPSIKSDVAFAGKLKALYPHSFVVLVGTHPSACAEETLGYSDAVDAVAIGEYDCIMNELANVLDAGKDLREVRGLCFWDGKEFVRTAPMPPMKNLDDLPFASQFIKEHLNERDYFFAAATYPSIQIFTGRGCPFRCNFCVYPQTMHGHAFRARSAENVVAEFEYIAANFPDVKEVVIEDDTFTANKKRVLDICRLLVEKKLNKRLKWLCNARVDLDLETMLAMKKAGCRLIIPGIESGSQQILDNIKKGTKVEYFYQYVANAKKAGLLIHACYMVGNQGETRETMEETLRLALRLNTDTAQFFPLIPYPGTEAYQWARENNYIETDYEKYCLPDGTHNTVLSLPDLSAGEMVDFCNRARKKYYLRASYILHRLRVGLRNPSDLKRSLKAFAKLKRYLFK